MDESRKQFVEFAKNNEFIVTIQNGEFLYPATRKAWKLWQASRVAIEVTLPEIEKWRSVESVRAQLAYRSRVIDEVSAAGIKVKE